MYLEQQENTIKDQDPYLAYQVHLYSREHAQVNSLHMSRFQKLSVDPGFTGDITPGCSVAGTTVDSGFTGATTGEALQMPQTSLDVTADEEDSGDEEDIGEITYKIFAMAVADVVNEEVTDGMSFFSDNNGLY